MAKKPAAADTKAKKKPAKKKASASSANAPKPAKKKAAASSAKAPAVHVKAGGDRVAVVAGLRTPFAKQWTAYKDVTALDLGRIVVRELLDRTELDVSLIEQVVYGQVVPSVSAPNIAREIVLGTGMPKNIEAYSV